MSVSHIRSLTCPVHSRALLRFTVLLNLYFAQWNILIIATNVLISITYSYTVVILIETGDQAASKIWNTFVMWQPHKHISEIEIIDSKIHHLASIIFFFFYPFREIKAHVFNRFWKNICIPLEEYALILLVKFIWINKLKRSWHYLARNTL
jgi:hypothetical protein